MHGRALQGIIATETGKSPVQNEKSCPLILLKSFTSDDNVSRQNEKTSVFVWYHVFSKSGSATFSQKGGAPKFC